jgi:hypothetical protein
MAGLPVTKRDYYFAVTGSDAAANTKQLYRIPVFTKEDAVIFLNHPEDMWDFDEPTHRVRLVTCRIMAAALINGENSIVVEGVTYQIVQWLRAYERV